MLCRCCTPPFTIHTHLLCVQQSIACVLQHQACSWHESWGWVQGQQGWGRRRQLPPRPPNRGLQWQKQPVRAMDMAAGLTDKTGHHTVHGLEPIEAKLLRLGQRTVLTHPWPASGSCTPNRIGQTQSEYAGLARIALHLQRLSPLAPCLRHCHIQSGSSHSSDCWGLIQLWQSHSWLFKKLTSASLPHARSRNARAGGEGGACCCAVYLILTDLFVRWRGSAASVPVDLAPAAPVPASNPAPALAHVPGNPVSAALAPAAPLCLPMAGNALALRLLAPSSTAPGLQVAWEPNEPAANQEEEG